MTDETRALADSVTERILAADLQPGDLSDCVEEVVRSSLSTALREAGPEADALALVDDAAQGVVRSLKKVGPIWHAARGAVAGILKGTLATRLDPHQAIVTATTVLVRETMATDSDFGAAAIGAVQGAVAGAEARGIDASAAGTSAARTAFAVANETRQAAGARVRHIIGERVGGVPVATHQ